MDRAHDVQGKHYLLEHQTLASQNTFREVLLLTRVEQRYESSLRHHHFNNHRLESIQHPLLEL